MSVSTNGVDFAPPRLLFTYQTPVEVEGLDPSQGPQQGRTLVSVLGRGFVQSDSLKCKFATVVVDAIFVSSTMLNCTAPAMSAGAVALEVSNNAVDFSRSDATFNYVPIVKILQISPPAGPPRGSTIVSVLGVVTSTA